MVSVECPSSQNVSAGSLGGRGRSYSSSCYPGNYGSHPCPAFYRRSAWMSLRQGRVGAWKVEKGAFGGRGPSLCGGNRLLPKER